MKGSLKPILIILSSITLFLLVSLLLRTTKEKVPQIQSYQLKEEGDSLYVYINLSRNIYSSTESGYPTGFCYQILKKYSKDRELKLKIISPFEKLDSAIFKDSLDFIMISTKDLLFSQGPINGYMNEKLLEKYHVMSYNPKQLTDFRRWFNEYKESEKYEDLRDKYLTNYNIYSPQNINNPKLSPYDDIIKKYSDTLKWDWKLLAALIYQESKFTINASSRKDACGLMQILSTTAAHYDIHDLFDPESNILAGVSHLAYLQELMRRVGVQEEDLIDFTLAAYNAGQGRIMQCRRLTELLGKDKNSWTDVSSCIPLMSKREYYSNPEYKISYFQGRETIKYVDRIYELYFNLE